MESLNSPQPNPQTRWLPALIVSLVALVILTFLVCGSALAFIVIAGSSVQPARADETGSSPTPVKIGIVKPTAVPTPLPPATSIVGSAYASLIPDLEVPDGLFFPDKGDSNFDPTAGRALYVQGDWIVYANLMESILPVPGGWKTVETGQDTYILYSPVEDWEQPAIRVRLSIYAYEDDATTSAVPVAEFVNQVKEAPTYTLLKQEILDDNTGYVFGAMSTESGKQRYLLQVFSKYADNPSGKFFHVYSVFTDQADWETYYPLIQAMLANWHALDNTPIAVSLPDTLPQ